MWQPYPSGEMLLSSKMFVFYDEERHVTIGGRFICKLYFTSEGFMVIDVGNRKSMDSHRTLYMLEDSTS